MSSVLRSVRKRKKGRTLGSVDIIDREEYAELEIDAKVELIRSLVPLGLMHIEELLDEEVTALAGERYARKDPSVGGRRHGSNPGTAGLAGQRVPIRVPRIRQGTGPELPLRSYAALHSDRAVNDLLLRRVLYGISRSGTCPGRTSWPWCWTARDLRRIHDGRCAGHHDDGGETLPGLCRNGHREREGVDAVPPIVGRAGPRCLPRSSGDRGRRQGAPGGRPQGVPPPRVGPTVSVAQARERGELPGQERASVVAPNASNGRTTVPHTTKPSQPSTRSMVSWRTGTNQRLAVSRKAWRRP